MIATRPEVCVIPIARLIVDHEVQRSLDKRWVAARVDEYDPMFVGVLHVSDRGDGTFHVMDGQHRMDLTIAAGHGDESLRCLTYTGLDRPTEAALFRHLNNKRNVQPLDKFRVRVVEGDQVAIGLSKVLLNHGWRIAGYSGDGMFAAVSALEAVYRNAPGEYGDKMTVCGTTINVITAAWGHSSGGVRAEVITGLGAVLTRHAGVIDLPKLTHELAKFDGGPLALIGRAKGLRSLRGGRVGDSLAEIVVSLVNKGRRVNKLPDWRDA